MPFFSVKVPAGNQFDATLVLMSYAMMEACDWSPGTCPSTTFIGGDGGACGVNTSKPMNVIIVGSISISSSAYGQLELEQFTSVMSMQHFLIRSMTMARRCFCFSFRIARLALDFTPLPPLHGAA